MTIVGVREGWGKLEAGVGVAKAGGGGGGGATVTACIGINIAAAAAAAAATVVGGGGGGTNCGGAVKNAAAVCGGMVDACVELGACILCCNIIFCAAIKAGLNGKGKDGGVGGGGGIPACW